MKVKVGSIGKNNDIGVKGDIGGNQNKPYFELEYLEGKGWILRQNSVQEGFEIGLLAKTKDELNSGLDSSFLLLKKGYRVKMGMMSSFQLIR